MSETIQRFYYKKKFLKSPVILGLGYLSMGILGAGFCDHKYMYFFIVAGLGFIVENYLKKTKGYISIDDKFIRNHHGWPKKIELEKITGIRYYVGDLTVLSDKKSMSIEKEFLDEEDFQQLEAQIKAILSQNLALNPKLNKIS